MSPIATMSFRTRMDEEPGEAQFWGSVHAAQKVLRLPCGFGSGAGSLVGIWQGFGRSRSWSRSRSPAKRPLILPRLRRQLRHGRMGGGGTTLLLSLVRLHMVSTSLALSYTVHALNLHSSLNYFSRFYLKTTRSWWSHSPVVSPAHGSCLYRQKVEKTKPLQIVHIRQINASIPMEESKPFWPYEGGEAVFFFSGSTEEVGRVLPKRL
jgi:hypothetical protein